MTPWKTTNCSAVHPDGSFIVFEGIDGAGKSTQAKKLVEKLIELGIPTLLTAEPSQSPAGRIIRSFKTRPDPGEEVRLFTEDRRHHVQQVIQPTLDAVERLSATGTSILRSCTRAPGAFVLRRLSL